MRRYLARLCHNGANWAHPTKSPQYRDSQGNYHTRNGFGHEEWLFRFDWMIDGWRYAFVEGVNSSHRRLVAERVPFDLFLFEVDRQGRRRYVAQLENVQCLDDADATWAVAEFKRQGWFQTMEEELRSVGAIASALGNSPEARHILNIRFRPESWRPMPADVFATPDDPICRINRFGLSDLDPVERKDLATQRQRMGSETPPIVRPYMRRGTAPSVCTPDHARMQAELMRLLRLEYPTAEIVREGGWIDVTVRTSSEILLFEIKPDLDPRSAIRQALGQILEYAYHPHRRHDRPLRLFIVGRNTPAAADKTYLDLLRSRFALPIDYRVVTI